MSLSVDAAGNLLPTGKPFLVRVANTTAECAWRLTDADGQEVAAGRTGLPLNGEAEIKIPSLPPGYYELTCTAGEEKRTLRLGVIRSHADKPPPDGPLNVDAAAAWLTPPEQFEKIARILRMMGIGWVRERFSWGHTEPERDKVEPRQYEAIAAAYAREGVRVYQIFHDSPGWTRANDDLTRNPVDLRDVYRFAQRVGKQYRRRVLAWEVWNEPDIGFWPDLSDTYAGVLKAAYLGFKAAEPSLLVLIGSFCRGVCDFDRHLLENGVSDYFDIFNWHIYAQPERYADQLGAYLNLLKRYGLENRPVWLTEAGIRLWASEADGELSRAAEREQAEFIPRSFASSLAAGTDRHFYFVFPYYLENGVQFGALHRDLSPRPACVAIAAAVDLLGEGRYLGRLPLPESNNATAHAFWNGRERVLVIWAEKEQEITLAVGTKAVRVADLFGKERGLPAENGRVHLTIGPAAQYVLGVGKDIEPRLVRTVRPGGRLPKTKPCPVIVRGQLQTRTIDKAHDVYRISLAPQQYVVEAYNFGDATAVGSVTVEIPAGWQIEPQKAAVSLEPGGRVALPFTITPGGELRNEHYRLLVHPHFAGYEVTPALSCVAFDFSRLPPRETKDLGLDKAERWNRNISGNGRMEIIQEEGCVRFDISFHAAGDRWAYPLVAFDPPHDFSRYQGIRFEYRCEAARAETTVRLQVVEEGGAHYLCEPLPTTTEWRPVVLCFSDLDWGSFSRPDMNGRLDLDKISMLLIGLNTSLDKATLYVRRVCLLRW